MDRYYILGSGIREAELNDVIKAESNPFVAAGISASRLENDQAAIDASQAAVDEWKQPTNTKLYVEDFTSRLGFYKQFLNAANREGNDHLKFLEREIAHVEAQGLDSADYTEASWANYAEKLAEAKAVAAGNDEFAAFNSRIYDVKYNLMVAYKNLLAKDASLIEAGGTADLEANIAIAEEIFASLKAGDGVWALSEEYEGEADDAYAALISALGYYYVGEDENTWNLYADSAYEYRDNDRPNNQNNQAKVNASNAALEAAILNFEKAAPPELVLKDYGMEMGAVVYKTEDMFDGFQGVIFGIDTHNGEMIADYVATEAGSIEVLPNDYDSDAGTGAIVNLLDDNGDVVESYVFILFGDVNGDGFIDSVDSGVIAEAEVGFAEFDAYAYEFAGDYDGSGYFDSVDAGYVAEYEVGLYDITQAEIAVEAVANYGLE